MYVLEIFLTKFMTANNDVADCDKSDNRISTKRTKIIRKKRTKIIMTKKKKTIRTKRRKTKRRKIIRTRGIKTHKEGDENAKMDEIGKNRVGTLKNHLKSIK